MLVASVSSGAGCKRESSQPAGASPLLAEVKTALAERGRRLTSFHIAGVVREAGQEAPFEAWYRAPNRVRGALDVGAGREFSFDGEKIYDLDVGGRTLVTYEVSPERRDDDLSVTLNQIVGAFVPEGYRVPILDLGAARAERLSHPKGPQSVALTSQTRDEEGRVITVVYVLRWPSADLIEKRLTYGLSTRPDSGADLLRVLSVEEEHCEKALRLCTPRRLVEREGGAEGAVTTLSRIDLNAPVPADAFAIAAPKGFTVRKEILGGAD